MCKTLSSFGSFHTVDFCLNLGVDRWPFKIRLSLAEVQTSKSFVWFPFLYFSPNPGAGRGFPLQPFPGSSEGCGKRKKLFCNEEMVVAAKGLFFQSLLNRGPGHFGEGIFPPWGLFLITMYHILAVGRGR